MYYIWYQIDTLCVFFIRKKKTDITLGDQVSSQKRDSIVPMFVLFITKKEEGTAEGRATYRIKLRG